MKKINPHNPKYFDYYMELAKLTAKQSVAKKRQVGAIIVLPSGLIGLGWNGMPAGFENECEEMRMCTRTGVPRLTTKPEVIHAERNALDKLTREGVSPNGAILFTTTEPCVECAKSIAAVGIHTVLYDEHYRTDDGTKFLMKSDVEVINFNK